MWRNMMTTKLERVEIIRNDCNVLKKVNEEDFDLKVSDAQDKSLKRNKIVGETFRSASIEK